MPNNRNVALMLDLGWPYSRHVDVFAGTQRYAQECGNWLCHVDEFPHTRLPTRRGKNLPYDGIIARATPELVERARKCGVPVVNVWWNSPATKVPSICPDIVLGGRLAAEHLLQRGYRHFACLSTRRDRGQRLQRDMFRSTVEEEGFDCLLETTTSDYPLKHSLKIWQGYEQQIESWIDTWELPIGVLVTHLDITSRHIVIACQRRGLKLPDDVGLITCQDEKMLVINPPPSLTCITMDFQKVGYQAALWLDRLMDGEPEPDELRQLLPVRLTARQSTGFASSDDDLVSVALRFINQHANEPIGVEEVVHGVHCSRRTLERRFRDCLGRSVAGEIRRLRVERAKQFLRDTDLSLAVVALRCGFPNAQSLCEIFRRETDMAPAKFRSEKNGEENR